MIWFFRPRDQEIARLKSERSSLKRRLRAATKERDALANQRGRDNEENAQRLTGARAGWDTERDRLLSEIAELRKARRELEEQVEVQSVLIENLEAVTARDRERVRLEMATAVAQRKLLEDPDALQGRLSNGDSQSAQT